MNQRDIAHYRLITLQIADSPRPTVAEVVGHLVAVQAQDYGNAMWAIGCRVRGSTENTVEEAITRRSIVRTWPMRGTLHYVAADDVRWLQELLSPRVIAGAASRARSLNLDDATFARCRDLFRATLQGGHILTREAMEALLERDGLTPLGQRGYHVLWRLSQEGLLCHGPRDGKQQTFVLLDEWLPDTPRLERDAALAELARRYFRGHGPATVHDFAWWSGLKVTDCNLGVKTAAPDLYSAVVDGKTYWMPADLPDLATLPHLADSAYLLPGFDEHILGYTDRIAVLDPAHAPQVCPGSNGMFMPTMVHDGRVVGTWKATVRKKAIAIRARPFAPLSKSAIAALTHAADRYAAFCSQVAEFTGGHGRLSHGSLTAVRAVS